MTWIVAQYPYAGGLLTEPRGGWGAGGSSVQLELAAGILCCNSSIHGKVLPVSDGTIPKAGFKKKKKTSGHRANLPTRQFTQSSPRGTITFKVVQPEPGKKVGHGNAISDLDGSVNITLLQGKNKKIRASSQQKDYAARRRTRKVRRGSQKEKVRVKRKRETDCQKVAPCARMERGFYR